MISRKYYHYVFVFMMAMSMALVLSFFSTISKEGLSGQFVFHWLSTAVWSFSIAFPTALVASPLARWVTEKLIM